ncbi:MAG: hypothetical protein RR576_12310 [Oscillospiraceae bacterium]
MITLVESVSILAITACIIVLFLRSGRTDYAASTMPILVVPLVHSFTWGVSKVMHNVLQGYTAQVVLSFADIAALAVSCLLIFFFSSKIKSTKNKKLYIILLSGYNIILTCAFVYQTMFSIIV